MAVWQAQGGIPRGYGTARGMEGREMLRRGR